MYLTLTRPDIAFVVHLMARFEQNPYVEYLLVAKNILRYLAGTKDLALKYSKLSSFMLSRYIDFDYGGDKGDMKSTIGYVFSIGSGVIS